MATTEFKAWLSKLNSKEREGLAVLAAIFAGALLFVAGVQVGGALYGLLG